MSERYVATSIHIRQLMCLGSTLALAAVSIAASGAPPARAANGGCPNEARRVEQGSTYLPDCRAYELVSPPDGTPYLEGPLAQGESGGKVIGAQASSAGGAIAWFSYNPISDGQGGSFYNLSTRGPSGWSTAGVTPRLSTGAEPLFACHPSILFSSDLSRSILSDGKESDGLEQNPEGEGNHPGYCGSNDPPLVADEPEGFQDLFLRDDETGSYRLVNVTPAGAPPADAWVQDASADFSHVVFEEDAKLTTTPEAPAGENLYEWVNGVVHLVTLLPDGAPVEGSLPYAASENRGATSDAAPYTHAMSADGTRVFFEAEGGLYVRENPEQEPSRLGAGGECLESAKACTVQLDASQASGPGGGGEFLAANAEGTKVFFMDEAGAMLTSDTQAGSGRNLYEYELEAGKTTGTLTDLTPVADPGVDGLSGIGEDGSYFYFVAEGVLASGASAGEPNLYALHGGVATFIATLEPEGALSPTDANGDVFDWNPERLTARVSPNGEYIAFDSLKRLKTANFPAGYDNTDVNTREADTEIYLYDAATSELSCVSCDPTGVPPTGAAAIQAAEPTANEAGPAYLQRNVLDDGSVFFSSPDALVPGDVNGKTDVYEYAGGRLHLISSGTSSEDSFFYDASPSGEDVFFVTTQHLLAGDTDSGPRLYDARAGGGFAEPVAPATCNGEECKGPALGAPVSPPLASAGLTGSGNLQSSPKMPHKTAKKIAKKAAKLTRAQQLARALKACERRKDKHARAACVRQVRRRYGAKAAAAQRHAGRRRGGVQ